MNKLSQAKQTGVRVSWQSVVMFAVAAMFFAFLGWLRKDAVTAFVGPAVTFFTWILQGPERRSTGRSLFPPKPRANMVSIVEAQDTTPFALPKSEPVIEDTVRLPKGRP